MALLMGTNSAQKRLSVDGEVEENADSSSKLIHHASHVSGSNKNSLFHSARGHVGTSVSTLGTCLHGGHSGTSKLTDDV